MNTLELGVALIRKIDDQIYWLGKMNDSTGQVDFIIAQRLEKESCRETILREVAWELELDRNRDIIVSNMAQLNVDFEAVLHGQTDPSRIICSFYNVELYRRAAIKEVDDQLDTVWMTSKEICNGVTDCGISLNPMFVLMNQHANVIQPWESDLAGDG